MCKILCSEEGFGEIRCGWEIIRADNVVIVSVKAIALYVVFIFKELRAICWGRARIKGNMLLMGNGLGQSIVVGKIKCKVLWPGWQGLAPVSFVKYKGEMQYILAR